MKTGTKSVLFGAHQFLIHPLFVAAAWTRLYGFPTNPRLWVAFYVHDLGYWGKERMDDDEGERHVEWGAILMSRLFDRDTDEADAMLLPAASGDDWKSSWRLGEWGQFCLLHSRFYAKKHNRPYSRLCVADKLAICLDPWWFYLPRVIVSGELAEYMAIAADRENAHDDLEGLRSRSPRRWYEAVQGYMRKWVEEHRDLRPDTWTPTPAERNAM